MLCTHVVEVTAAGTRRRPLPRTQRELVALSLEVAPKVALVRPVVERDVARGMFR